MKMKQIMVVLLVLSGGCAPYAHMRHIDDVQVGMTYEEVQTLVGNPIAETTSVSNERAVTWYKHTWPSPTFVKVYFGSDGAATKVTKTK